MMTAETKVAVRAAALLAGHPLAAGLPRRVAARARVALPAPRVELQAVERVPFTARQPAVAPSTNPVGRAALLVRAEKTLPDQAVKAAQVLAMVAVVEAVFLFTAQPPQIDSTIITLD
jgi:hypothetical protein